MGWRGAWFDCPGCSICQSNSQHGRSVPETVVGFEQPLLAGVEEGGRESSVGLKDQSGYHMDELKKTSGACRQTSQKGVALVV